VLDLFVRLGVTADANNDTTLMEAVSALYELVRERDMYRDRCLAAAKQCDEMTLKLQEREARPTKAKGQ